MMDNSVTMFSPWATMFSPWGELKGGIRTYLNTVEQSNRDVFSPRAHDLSSYRALACIDSIS